MGKESKEISKLGNSQETVLITVGRLELRLDEAQQLTLTHLAFLAFAGTLNSLFGHGKSSSGSFSSSPGKDVVKTRTRDVGLRRQAATPRDDPVPW
jgi:hypothetical protein